jgi:hypothetical protein
VGQVKSCSKIQYAGFESGSALLSFRPESVEKNADDLAWTESFWPLSILHNDWPRNEEIENPEASGKNGRNSFDDQDFNRIFQQIPHHPA